MNEIEGVIYEENNNFEMLDSNDICKIVCNTSNTWQSNRKTEEKENNTIQGKLGEEVVENFIKDNLTNLHVLTYDEIRCDSLKKHAPFDFLLWNNNTIDINSVILSVQNDINNAQDQFVRLSDYTRKICQDQNIKIAEVKSTSISVIN